MSEQVTLRPQFEDGMATFLSRYMVANPFGCPFASNNIRRDMNYSIAIEKLYLGSGIDQVYQAFRERLYQDES